MLHKSIISISLIYSFRIFGIFIILPVITLHNNIPYSTPTLIGIALGIYGMTQSFLQVILSTLSDKYGRKPIIYLGLSFFILGSLIAGLSSNIYGIIVGRFFQGCGAIGSTLIALLTDITNDNNRTQSMSIIGMSIGMTFIISIIISPIIDRIFGLEGIFLLTALFGIVSIILLYCCIPDTKIKILYDHKIPIIVNFKKLLFKTTILQLYYGIFFLHCILTMFFLILPRIIQETLKIDLINQWVIYLPVLLISFSIIMPFFKILDNKQCSYLFHTVIYIIAIILLTLSQLCLIFVDNPVIIFVLFVLFFTYFSFLESYIPSRLSKLVEIKNKGIALGIYSTFQFLGIFFGGVLGGFILDNLFYIKVMLVFNTMIGILWILISMIIYKFNKDIQYKVYKIKLSSNIQDLKNNIIILNGVKQVEIFLDEIHLKCYKKTFQETILLDYLRKYCVE